MSLYQQPGYKRLAIVFPIIALVVSIIIVYPPFQYGVVGSVGNSLAIATTIYILFRLIYWIIDGFKSHK